VQTVGAPLVIIGRNFYQPAISNISPLLHRFSYCHFLLVNDKNVKFTRGFTTSADSSRDHGPQCDPPEFFRASLISIRYPIDFAYPTLSTGFQVSSSIAEGRGGRGETMLDLLYQ
jgi:hypothetical protein